MQPFFKAPQQNDLNCVLNVAKNGMSFNEVPTYLCFGWPLKKFYFYDYHVQIRYSFIEP